MSAITPRLVRSLIHKGLEQGWNPKEIGRGFSLQASESLYEQVKQERAQAESGACNIPDKGELLCVVPSFYASDREWPFRSIPFEVAHFRLCGDVNDQMIGTFFAHMAAGNSDLIPKGLNQQQVLTRLLRLLSQRQSRWLKEGGVCFVVDGHFVLSCGCCSDWSGWRTWESLLETGKATGWNGHDPESYAERSGDRILFIEGLDEVASRSLVGYRQFVSNLRLDLQSFIIKALAWLAQRVSEVELKRWEEEFYIIFNLK